MGSSKGPRSGGRHERTERRRSLVGRRWTDGLRPEIEREVEDIVAGPLRILDQQKKVFIHGDEKHLTPKEYELLRILAANEGRVLSSEELALILWRGKSLQSTEEVKQYVYLLRKKIESHPDSPRLIRSVKGFGYVLVADANQNAF